MGERTREYAWYLEALDADSNEIIAKNLGDDQSCGEYTCADLQRRQLFRCDSKFVAKIRMSRAKFNLHFKVFVQEGRGPIRLWPFQKKDRGHCRVLSVARITQKTG
ncbi:MAG: hypothetical protein AAB358_02245 [Patescibacteria group bacterium]